MEILWNFFKSFIPILSFLNSHFSFLNIDPHRTPDLLGIKTLKCCADAEKVLCSSHDGVPLKLKTENDRQFKIIYRLVR